MVGTGPSVWSAHGGVRKQNRVSQAVFRSLQPTSFTSMEPSLDKVFRKVLCTTVEEAENRRVRNSKRGGDSEGHSGPATPQRLQVSSWSTCSLGPKRPMFVFNKEVVPVVGSSILPCPQP